MQQRASSARGLAASRIWLESNRTTLEAAEWRKWLRTLRKIRDEFCRTPHVGDPLLFNEVASVGALARAASRAGFLALVESVATKRGAGPGRPHRNGRCDLWVADADLKRSWAFEFKQCFARPGIRVSTIASRLEQACKDARAVHSKEADASFGALLITAARETSLPDETVQRIEQAAKETFFACRLDGGSQPAWLLIERAEP